MRTAHFALRPIKHLASKLPTQLVQRQRAIFWQNWEKFGGKPFLVFFGRTDPLESKSAGCTCDTLVFFLKFKMADGGHVGY